MTTQSDYDVAVVGSGFGGSISALRLTEKGYRVAVFESGRRFGPDDYAKTNWNFRRFLWAPTFGMRGIFRLTILPDIVVASGAGVGGGSLVYAQAMYVPPDEAFRDSHWSPGVYWKAELRPFYDLASRMLGVTTNTWHTDTDDVLLSAARRLGVAETFAPTPVSAFLGTPGVQVPDPYFGGVGPTRTGCIGCGACIVGCRFNAKNTLDHNYLYLAERAGCMVHPEREVMSVRPLPGGGYALETERPGAWLRKQRTTFTADQVVMSASVLGTLKLLLRMKHRNTLPNLSHQLGALVRTNSESIVAASQRSGRLDFSRGVAITSAIHPDSLTQTEAFRFPAGSSATGLAFTIQADPIPGMPRWASFLRQIVRSPKTFLQSLQLTRWPQRTMLLLNMQYLDNSLRFTYRPGRFRDSLSSQPEPGLTAAPRYLPVAATVARAVAASMSGYARDSWASVLGNVSATAHIMGGAVVGASPDTGVVDPYHRVYGHPGLSIIDASTIGANLSVNPALTIAAMAERALAFWPNKGEPDQRPSPGDAYRSIDPIKPDRPVVPGTAPAALR